MKRSINNKKPNKGGCPTKKLSEKRKYRITVKMATEEYYAMKLKAKNAGVSASEIVRMAIRDCHIKARLTTEQADYIRKLCGMANNLNQLTRKYGLYFANGKEQVKTHRLKEPDKTRYGIYQVLKREVARCSDWTTLLKRLKAEGIDVRFKYKGNTNDVQGIVFTKNGYHFNGSKIDRSFSYSKIDKALNGNNQAEYQRQYEPHHMQISHFDNKESELISGSLGLLDFTSSPDVDSQEEADFRRLMQQKTKKKRTRGFKL